MFWRWESTTLFRGLVNCHIDVTPKRLFMGLIRASFVPLNRREKAVKKRLLITIENSHTKTVPFGGQTL
jgi:hypothetical protein